MKKLLLAVLGVAMLVGCGRDSGKNHADAAQIPQNCWQNGGVGCNWPSYPQYYQAYPRYDNGYYYGYNNINQSYQSLNGCNQWGQSYYPVFHSSYGLACLFFSPGNYGYPMYQNYAYYSCSGGDWSSCPAGTRCSSNFVGEYGVCINN